MTKQDQAQLGRTLWNIADQLLGAMSADTLTEVQTKAPEAKHLEGL